MQMASGSPPQDQLGDDYNLTERCNEDRNQGDVMELADRSVWLQIDTPPTPRQGEAVPQNGALSTAPTAEEDQCSRCCWDTQWRAQNYSRPNQEVNQGSKKSMKAAMRIASLGDKDSRWMHVNQIMQEEKIGILAIQEAHLNEERKGIIENIFPKLQIEVSEDPEKPTSKAGVALVLNK